MEIGDKDPNAKKKIEKTSEMRVILGLNRETNYKANNLCHKED